MKITCSNESRCFELRPVNQSKQLHKLWCDWSKRGRREAAASFTLGRKPLICHRRKLTTKKNRKKASNTSVLEITFNFHCQTGFRQTVFFSVYFAAVHLLIHLQFFRECEFIFRIWVSSQQTVCLHEAQRQTLNIQTFRWGVKSCGRRLRPDEVVGSRTEPNGCWTANFFHWLGAK